VIRSARARLRVTRSPLVSAPAGVILGHVALSQIHETGDRGRDRALVGVTLSYVFITAVVVALIVAAAGVQAR
jgi:hypothetical protein